MICSDDQKRFDKYIRTKTRNPSLAASKVGLSAHQSDIEKGKIENLIKTEINNLDIKIEDKGIIEPIPQKEQRINRYARLDTAPQYFRRTSTDILDPKLMPMPTGDQSPLLRPIQEQDQKEAYIIKIHEEKESKTKLNENEEHQDTSVHNEINNGKFSHLF